MYCVSCYSYETKKHQIVAHGSKNNMTEYIEAYIMNYIDKMQGSKYTSFGGCLKKSGQTITTKEWDNDIRYFVTRSNNNMSKYVIQHMAKTKGYMYNSYKTTKVKTVYLIENAKIRKKTTERRTTDFDHNEDFSKVIEQITGDIKSAKIKPVNVQSIYNKVIDELKEIF